ncbi:MAG: DUF2344 domain-containing protein [Clostridia bacterium]|nr:DUF2344 domain-containing protein [Clostridia bacterium]
MRMLIRFGKNPRLRFISHLDLQRFLHMALNRTGLPIKYSEGFNPHPLMAFGSALALGWTSEYELLDVRLSAPMGRKRCEEAMRFALPEDLPVLEVKLLEDRDPSIMQLVYASDYHIRLDGENAQAVKDQVASFLAEEEVLAMKKTKSGEKEINIRPLALKVEVCKDGLNARLMLTEKDALKADLLVKTLAERAGVETPEVRIHRVCLLAKDKEGDLKPLMEL